MDSTPSLLRHQYAQFRQAFRLCHFDFTLTSLWSMLCASCFWRNLFAEAFEPRSPWRCSRASSMWPSKSPIEALIAQHRSSFWSSCWILWLILLHLVGFCWILLDLVGSGWVSLDLGGQRRTLILILLVCACLSWEWLTRQQWSAKSQRTPQWLTSSAIQVLCCHARRFLLLQYLILFLKILFLRLLCYDLFLRKTFALYD